MGSASKWFLCFRAPATIDLDLGGDGTVDCSADRVLTYIAVAKKKNKEMKKKKKMMNDKNKPSQRTETAIPISDHQKDEGSPNPPRRNFPCFIKAVLFKNAPSRRAREKKSRKCPDSSMTKVPSDQNTESVDTETGIKIHQVATEERDRKTARSVNPPVLVEAAAEAGEGSSSQGSNWGEEGLDSGRRTDHRMRQVVYLMIFSLWVTVFWGRCLAVMTTTVWIYAWESRRAALVLSLLGKKHKKTTTTTKGREKVREEEEEEQVVKLMVKKGNHLQIQWKKQWVESN